MTPEQYAASQAAITAGLAAYVQRMASLFTGPLMTAAQWLGFLRILFPEVQKRYAMSAELGRSFYDYQRKQFHPDIDRHEMYLSELQWEWFVQNMEPARKALSQADAPQVAVSKVTLTAVREVEMAGRRQIIGAVKNDEVLKEELERVTEPFSDEEMSELRQMVGTEKATRTSWAAGSKVETSAPTSFPKSGNVLGWARVATGRETCAWCLMLISRGAEFPGKDTRWYTEAVSAGINLDDETVLDLWEESGGDLAQFREETKEYIEEWHTGCDCLVVPVFDIKNWPGREGAQRAQQLWIDAGREASRLIESGESRTKNMNKETLNALRRRLERGEINMSTYAIAA